MKTKVLLITAMVFCFLCGETVAQEKEKTRERKERILGKNSETGNKESFEERKASSVKERLFNGDKEKKGDEVKSEKFKKTKVEKADSTLHYKHLSDSLLQVLEDRNRVIESLKKELETEVAKTVESTGKERELMILISGMEKEIGELKAKESSIDTNIVRLANRWLFEKFDKVAVKEAIELFDKVCDGEWKNKYYVVRDLLSIYEESYGEFQQILREAQNDSDRTETLGFVCDDYKNKYKQRIESMSYYIKYHSVDADWCIVYLSNKIDEALKLLGKHSESNTVDFSSIIDNEFFLQ